MDGGTKININKRHSKNMGTDDDDYDDGDLSRTGVKPKNGILEKAVGHLPGKSEGKIKKSGAKKSPQKSRTGGETLIQQLINDDQHDKNVDADVEDELDEDVGATLVKNKINAKQQKLIKSVSLSPKDSSSKKTPKRQSSISSETLDYTLKPVYRRAAANKASDRIAKESKAGLTSLSSRSSSESENEGEPRDDMEHKPKPRKSKQLSPSLPPSKQIQHRVQKPPKSDDSNDSDFEIGVSPPVLKVQGGRSKKTSAGDQARNKTPKANSRSAKADEEQRKGLFLEEKENRRLAKVKDEEASTSVDKSLTWPEHLARIKLARSEAGVKLANSGGSNDVDEAVKAAAPAKKAVILPILARNKAVSSLVANNKSDEDGNRSSPGVEIKVPAIRKIVPVSENDDRSATSTLKKSKTPKVKLSGRKGLATHQESADGDPQTGVKQMSIMAFLKKRQEEANAERKSVKSLIKKGEKSDDEGQVGRSAVIELSSSSDEQEAKPVPKKKARGRGRPSKQSKAVKPAEKLGPKNEGKTKKVSQVEVNKAKDQEPPKPSEEERIPETIDSADNKKDAPVNVDSEANRKDAVKDGAQDLLKDDKQEVGQAEIHQEVEIVAAGAGKREGEKNDSFPKTADNRSNRQKVATAGKERKASGDCQRSGPVNEYENMGYVSGDDATSYSEMMHFSKEKPIPAPEPTKEVASEAEEQPVKVDSTLLKTKSSSAGGVQDQQDAVRLTEEKEPVGDESSIGVGAAGDHAKTWEGEKATLNFPAVAVDVSEKEVNLTGTDDKERSQASEDDMGTSNYQSSCALENQPSSCSVNNEQQGLTMTSQGSQQSTTGGSTKDLGPSLGVFTPDSATNSVQSMHGSGGYQPGQALDGLCNPPNGTVNPNLVMESPNSISSVEMVSSTSTPVGSGNGIPAASANTVSNAPPAAVAAATSVQAYSEPGSNVSIVCNAPAGANAMHHHHHQQLLQQQQQPQQPQQPPPQPPQPPQPQHGLQQPHASPLMTAQSPHPQSLPSQSPHSQHNMTSPHPQMTSPHPQMASPHPQMTSPHPSQPSPHNVSQTSPHPMTISPASHSPYANPRGTPLPQPSPTPQQPQQAPAQAAGGTAAARRHSSRSPHPSNISPNSAAALQQHQHFQQQNQMQQQQSHMHHFQNMQRFYGNYAAPAMHAAAAMGHAAAANRHHQQQMAASFQAAAQMFPPFYTIHQQQMNPATSRTGSVGSTGGNQHHHLPSHPQGNQHQKPQQHSHSSSLRGNDHKQPAHNAPYYGSQGSSQQSPSPSSRGQSRSHAGSLAKLQQLTNGLDTSSGAGVVATSPAPVDVTPAPPRTPNPAAATNLSSGTTNSGRLHGKDHSHQSLLPPAYQPSSYSPHQGAAVAAAASATANTCAGAQSSTPRHPHHHFNSNLMQQYHQSPHAAAHHHMLSNYTGYNLMNPYMYHVAERGAAAGAASPHTPTPVQPGHHPGAHQAAPAQQMYPGYPLPYPPNYR